MGVEVSQTRRMRLRVEGAVQGVGFRPYVYRLATSLGLGGFVRNDTAGVLVEVEGGADAVGSFVERLPIELPPLAWCDRITTEELSVVGEYTFMVAPSAPASHAMGCDAGALVTPDIATCADCLSELFDPGDRRYRYPFVNCTNCGPRFTIIRGVPYDRERTTMTAFHMCARCRAEYVDPGNRRFHAQPNACPECGPTARLVDAGGRSVGDEAPDAVAAAATAIRDGAIVAVKGIGGYHLACRADAPVSVDRLRRCKDRADKPFAIMVRDVDAARRLVSLNVAELDLLTSRERPIVLAPRRVGAAVAPRQRHLGLMLPYTPLHHLLLTDAGVPLVLTSGNLSDEPIAYRDDDALTRLAAVADAFLTHDRLIERPVDDSVVRVVRVGAAHRRVTLRRSRGYVPVAMPLPVEAPDDILACGGQVKNTVCLARGDRAWVGPHTGDLGCYETFRSFTDGIVRLERLLSVVPRRIAYDLHPEYLSAKYAIDRLDAAPGEGIGVQHHHAHLAACLAEHGERGPVLGVIFDGTGYGTDGTLWGGELLVGDLASFERAGHLWPVAMPGGTAAVREPWRMACAWLSELASDVPPCPPTLCNERITPHRWGTTTRLARSPLSPKTTSMGRLLDAVAAICGVRDSVSYEGQAAIELEAIADPNECDRYPCPVLRDGGGVVLDARELVRAVVCDLARQVPIERIAARVHNGAAYATWRACVALTGAFGIDTVVLSGGVFQNVLLLERTAAWLVQGGYRVLIPERLPMNDGGVAYGQAAIAAARDHALRGVVPGSRWRPQA